MNLTIEIENELWEIIKKDYSEGNYSNAILDSMFFLTETIRNRTGLEGDGASLVGQAFGGETPRIQLNKLQTESEKDIQKGFQEILRGLYTAIRNPRSHDKIVDIKEEADSIISIVDYIIKVLSKTKKSFDEESLIKRLSDKYYVKSKEYSDLLVSEIPKRQRLSLGIHIINNRAKVDILNLRSFMASLINVLEPSDLTRIYQIINEELKYTSNEGEIRTLLNSFPPKDWCKIDKPVRMRIELLLLQNVYTGKYNEQLKVCTQGTLGTWVSREHILNFDNKNDWTQVIAFKLNEKDIEGTAYIDNYFWHSICEINRDYLHHALRNYFIKGFQSKDISIIERFKRVVTQEESHPWWNEFKEELISYPEIKYEKKTA